MLSQRGLKGTNFQDYSQAVGISKAILLRRFITLPWLSWIIRIIDYEISLCSGKYGTLVGNKEMRWSLEETIYHF